MKQHFLSSISRRLHLFVQGERAVGQVYRPVLSALDSAGVTIHTEVEVLMADIGIDASYEAPPPDNPPEIAMPFPVFYNSEELTRESLWNVVRATRPSTVVETGVANGVSTRTFLRALDLNGHGALHSFDVDGRVLEVVSPHDADRWVPKILQPRAAMTQLENWAKETDVHVDVWFHDSDHGFAWQLQEFQLASRVLRPGGLLISDDVDGTEAFAEFAKATPGWVHAALFDKRKVTGFSRKPESDVRSAEGSP